MSEPDEKQLRAQLTEAFQDADYPVRNAMELVPALPDGLGTRFESGEFSMTAMELNGALPDQDFPYDTVNELVDDIIEGLEAENYL